MIRFDSVSKQHGSQILFLEADLAVFKGEKVGLVGPNGSGKSTIFRLIVDEERADVGNVIVDRGVEVGYFSQNVGEMQGRSVLAETMSGAGEVAQLAVELSTLETAMADPAQADQLERLVARYGDVQARFDELDGYSLEARAREILAGLGFRAQVCDGLVDQLSGGWKMRVAIAKILLQRPDLLLLDEPTNHLDLESIIWLEGFLNKFEGALIITSHDRSFLDRLVTRIVAIDGGELTSYSGNYDFYRAQLVLETTQKEAHYARQQAMLAKEEAFIARFKARASHSAQVQSRIKKLDKIDKVQPPRRRRKIEFEFRTPPRSGDSVVTIEGMNKSYGDLHLYKNFELRIRRRERWCVLGINGAGKSTLLEMIAGRKQPDSGKVNIGASVTMGYFAQHSLEVLEPAATVIESLEAIAPTANLGSLMNLAGAFGFSGDDTAKRCQILSGGERARLVLAQMLYNPPNLLVLDEPTNHLDLDTKDTLVSALADFEGTLVFVSHDRSFLHGLSNRVLELDEGRAQVYEGGYAEYVARSGREAPGLRE